MSKFRGIKTNNARISGKRELREIAFDCLEDVRVLEVFCGQGEMYNAVWNRAAYYLGIDKEPVIDCRNVLVGDALACLNAVDFEQFNCFDIDAYGSPYPVLNEILKRIKKQGNYFFVVTDGVEIDLRMGNVEEGLRKFVNSPKKLKNAHLLHETFILKALDCIEKKYFASVSDFRIARGNTGSGMRYYCFSLRF